MFVPYLSRMSGLNYGAEGTAKALKERIRITNIKLDRLRGLKKSTQYRIDNSSDENEIKDLKNDIEKYDEQISSLGSDVNDCMKELMEIEERMGS